MAFGKHWEWRGFGTAGETLAATIRALPPVLESPWVLTDRYLWTPGATVNVKLREGDLKLKRFIEAAGGFECWLEDEAEIFSFPLSPDQVAALEAALQVTLTGKPRGPLDKPDLLALLDMAAPPVRLLTVEKSRRFHELRVPGYPVPVQVELTRLEAPEIIDTVGLEHPEPGPLRLAESRLDLARASLQPMNYLQALAIWACAATIGGMTR